MVDRSRRPAQSGGHEGGQLAPFFAGRLVALLLVACLLLFGLAGWREWTARDAHLRETGTALGNLADSLLQHADSGLKLDDYAVAAVVQRLEIDGATQAELARFDRALPNRIDDLPGVRGLTIYDKDGERIAGSLKTPLMVNDAGQAFFIHHRDDPDRRAFVGGMIKSRVGDAGVFTVSRRWNNPDGSFAGVVVARVEAAYFAGHFADYDLGPGGSISLVMNDGSQVARYPPVPSMAGTNLSKARLFAELRSRPFGSYQSLSLLDGVHRINGFHGSHATPLVVWVSSTTAAATHQWAVEARDHLVTMAALLGLVAALGLYLVQQVRRAHASEAEMHRSETQFRLLAETTTDVIIRIDLDLKRIYASPACREIFGLEQEEMLDFSPSDHVHPDSAAMVHEGLLRLASGAIDRYQESFQIQRKDGSTVWVEASRALLRDPVTGQPHSITSAIRDISARREQTAKLSQANEDLERLSRHLARARDQAEKASLAKSRFLASMSHELRTPLNGVLGYAHLLQLDGGLTRHQAPMVDAMLEAGAHLLNMINEVLDLSAIEQDKVSIQPVEMDLRGMAAHCIDLVRPAALAKGLGLAVSVDPDVPSRVTADPTRLRQIVLNLLGNAVKFTASGSVAFRIRLAGARLRLEVADTGPGITESDRSRLFEDFNRLDFAASSTVEGAGLGLAISARLAALMGGRLFHEDNPGRGSVFCLDLPCIEAAPADAAGTSNAHAALPARPLRVLLVDDMMLNREVAEAFLQSGGHTATCAESGEEAVAKAAGADFDVILMDVRMPGMDGLEASRRIRALDGARGQVAIVALTAQAFSSQIDDCGQAGMDAHLSKPFTPAALLEIVARAAGSGRQPRTHARLAEAAA